MPFNSDLAFGQHWENVAITLFPHDSFKIPKGKFKPYDIEFIKDGEPTYVEVKSDRLAHKTGNLAIEYECNDESSGITATKADYWIYFVIEPNNLYTTYKFPIEELTKFTEDEQYRRISGGDGYRSKMVLIPQVDLINFILNKGDTYYIPPTMTEQQPVTYTDRLVAYFKRETQESFTIEDIVQTIDEFKVLEAKRRTEKTNEVPVGKYKYKKVKDVASFDKQYLVWMMKQDWVNKYPEFVKEVNKYL